MGICSSYHIEYGKPVCYGTRERDTCDCEGDESKCNFYPKKWEKANNHCLNADLAIEGRKVEAKKQRMISN